MLLRQVYMVTGTAHPYKVKTFLSDIVTPHLRAGGSSVHRRGNPTVGVGDNPRKRCTKRVDKNHGDGVGCSLEASKRDRSTYGVAR
jgi:hypothetical protein